MQPIRLGGDWSSGGNRIPTFSGFCETRLAGWVITRRGRAACAATFRPDQIDSADTILRRAHPLICLSDTRAMLLREFVRHRRGNSSTAV